MRINNWIKWTIIILLTAVALGGVGFAGYRMGYMQGANATRVALQSKVPADGKNIPPKQFPFWGPMDSFRGGFNNQHGFGDQRGFDHRFGFNRGGREGFFSPLFGLFHLVLFGLLIWVVYLLFKNSGWQFVRIPASQAEEPQLEMKATKKKR